MSLIVRQPNNWEKLERSIEEWLTTVMDNLERRLRAGSWLRAAGKTEPLGKVQKTSVTLATPDTPARHHSWTQILMVPVTVVPDPADGEPILFFDEEALRLARDDPRVGCIICSMSLDEGWDTPCEGEL